MSTRTPFRCIDQELKKYHRRYGDHNAEDEIEEEDGIFLRCMNENCFQEEDIETELGKDSDPTQCAYVWALNEQNHFPVPSYLRIPEESKEGFVFYILQWIYTHHECPSDANIKDRIMPLVGGELVEDSISDAYYTCIDLRIETENDVWADDKSSAQYKRSQQDIITISRIINDHEAKDSRDEGESLIRLMAIFDGGNNLQLMNDLIVRVMLNASHHGHHNITNSASFRHIFQGFVQKEMKHFQYNHKKLKEYMRALYHMSISRWYGHNGIRHMMNDLSSETEEKNVHAEDPSLPYHATKVQSIFGAFMACVPHQLLSYKVSYCTARLILKSQTSRMDNVSEDMDHYINEFGRLFAAVDKNQIKNGVIISLVMEVGTDGSITCKGPYYDHEDETTQSVLDENRQLTERMRAKYTFVTTKDIGVVIHKLEQRIQCNVHNLYPLSVIRIEPRDLYRCLRCLFRYGSDSDMCVSTAFDARFREYLTAHNNVDDWSDFDSNFDTMLVKLMELILRTDPKLYTNIFGIERTDTQSFGSGNVLSSQKHCIFNAQTITRHLGLYNATQRSFGSNGIAWLNISTALQWDEIIQFTVKIEGKTSTFAVVNHFLQNRKNETLYTIIILLERGHNGLQWFPHAAVTAAQVLKMYAISRRELPDDERLSPALWKSLLHLENKYTDFEDELAQLNDELKQMMCPNCNPIKEQKEKPKLF